MKRILAFLTLTSCAIAGTWMASPGKGSHAAAGGGGPTFLLNTDFEGTGWPSDWWSGSSANPDSTTSPLAGAQSMRSLTSQPAVPASFSEATMYAKFMMRVSSLADASYILGAGDGSNTLFYLILLTDGTLLIDTQTGPSATTVATMSAGTTYYVWLRYTKGTGSNGIYRVWFNTTNTKPADGSNNSAGGTDMTHTTNFNNFDVHVGGAATLDIDNFQMAITEIP